MMRSFLSLLLCVSLSGVVSAQSSPYLTEMAEQWKNGGSYTLQVANLMPDSGYAFKPTADEMRFDEQLKQQIGSSKETIKQTLQQSLAFAQLAMENLPVGELDQTVKFFAGPKTKRQIVNLMHDHLTHHRAQVIVYLRLNGIKPPSYVGW